MTALKALSFVFALSLIGACGGNKSEPKDEKNGSDLDINAATISFPADDAPDLIDPKDLPEATYKLESVHTYTVYKEPKMRIAFVHSLNTLGDFTNEDKVRKAHEGLPADKRSSIEIRIPQKMTKIQNEMSMLDTGYYWNYVQGDGDWKWRFSISNKSSGSPILALLGLGQKRARGIFKSLSGVQLAVQLNQDRVTLTYNRIDSNGDQIYIRIVYVKTPVEALPQDSETMKITLGGGPDPVPVEPTIPKMPEMPEMPAMPAIPDVLVAPTTSTYTL